MNLFDPSNFTVSEARVLPVILLLDTSGSMAGSKIATLNRAVAEMLGTFRSVSAVEAAISVAVITFGGTARIQQPLAPAAQLSWHNLTADGGTPMGAALKLAKPLLEDRQAIPARAWRPALILISDGQPTDDWRGPVRALVEEGRSAKCDRMAMAIGGDAKDEMLRAFLGSSPHPLYRAANAGQIHEFFRFVTMSVTTRASSKTPNEIPAFASEAAPGAGTAEGAFF